MVLNLSSPMLGDTISSLRTRQTVIWTSELGRGPLVMTPVFHIHRRPAMIVHHPARLVYVFLERPALLGLGSRFIKRYGPNLM